MLELAEVSTLVVQLLLQRRPEFGARLKQRLNALLAERSQAPLNERDYGFKKFQELLEKGLKDSVHVIRQSDGGDILVNLNQHNDDDEEMDLPTTKQARPIRSDVWQAFTNTDTEKRFFLNRQNFVVTHTNLKSQAGGGRDAEFPSDRFAEIQPIPGTQQISWMRDFLDGVPITGEERNVYDKMLGQPYTGALNAAFTRAVGDKAVKWREQRTKLVFDTITQWTVFNQVPIDQLIIDKKKTSNNEAVDGNLTPRQQAAKILELISDDDIGRIVLPVLLSTILIKSRA